jgi:hypothetical protein
VLLRRLLVLILHLVMLVKTGVTIIVKRHFVHDSKASNILNKTIFSLLQLHPKANWMQLLIAYAIQSSIQFSN